MQKKTGIQRKLLKKANESPSPHLIIALTPRKNRPLRILIHRIAIPLNRPGRQPTRMKDIKNRNSSNHHSPIKRNKIPLVSNQIPIPALRQLNRPINTPRINTEHAENHRREQRRNRPGDPPQQPIGQRPPHEVRRTYHKYSYRE